MTNPILIIDPGHGGRDPGGGSNQYWREKDFVLQISLYQYDRFRQLGVPVVLTRDKDVFLSPDERTKLVRESGAKYCISNHINAAENKAARGAETIHSIYSDGKLAESIFSALTIAGMPGRRVFTRKGSNGRDYYFMHRETGLVETVIVEYGFATNAEDTVLLLEKWKDYAESVVEAFCRFIGNPYKRYDEVVDKLKLTDSQWNMLVSALGQMPIDKQWVEKAKKKELTLSELTWLNAIVLVRK